MTKQSTPKHKNYSGHDGGAPKKSLGQHWLNDDVSLQAMVVAADVRKTDVVLEIGPGLGTLTELLMTNAKSVVAVEFDDTLAASLPGRMAKVSADGKTPANLEVVHQDILKFDLTSLPADYKVVANIPYYLTSNLIRVLSESTNRPAAIALLVQKEVAERLAAKPGNLSILGVTAQFYWEISLGMVVGAELFTPPPKVDSQIVIMKRRSGPLFPDVDAKLFFRIVKAGFGAKRKTLLNSISGGLQLDKPSVIAWFEAAGIKPQLRAQALSLDGWYKLYRTVPAR
jgi:16S rRNA (adenine1518-N6/adenine1519-N6)-dimethyltransferase